MVRAASEIQGMCGFFFCITVYGEYFIFSLIKLLLQRVSVHLESYVGRCGSIWLGQNLLLLFGLQLPFLQLGCVIQVVFHPFPCQAVEQTSKCRIVGDRDTPPSVRCGPRDTLQSLGLWGLGHLSKCELWGLGGCFATLPSPSFKNQNTEQTCRGGEGGSSSCCVSGDVSGCSPGWLWWARMELEASQCCSRPGHRCHCAGSLWPACPAGHPTVCLHPEVQPGSRFQGLLFPADVPEAGVRDRHPPKGRAGRESWLQFQLGVVPFQQIRRN